MPRNSHFQAASQTRTDGARIHDYLVGYQLACAPPAREQRPELARLLEEGYLAPSQHDSQPAQSACLRPIVRMRSSSILARIDSRIRVCSGTSYGSTPCRARPYGGSLDTTANLPLSRARELVGRRCPTDKERMKRALDFCRMSTLPGNSSCIAG